MCLHHTDQDLFGLWDEWLRQNGEYKDLDPERAWDSFATRVNGERVTIASLFHLANETQPGWSAAYDFMIQTEVERAAHNADQMRAELMAAAARKPQAQPEGDEPKAEEQPKSEEQPQPQPKPKTRTPALQC